MAATPLNDAEVIEKLANLPGWERDGGTIKKTYHVDKYLSGLAFASAVGTIAEGFDHHPDLFIGYKKVEVAFTTHDAGSQITQKDIDVASAIEALPYPKA